MKNEQARRAANPNIKESTLRQNSMLGGNGNGKRMTENASQQNRTGRAGFLKYSMLCTSRVDGDGQELANKLNTELVALLALFDDRIKVVGCRYVSDGEFRAKFLVAPGKDGMLSDLLYSNVTVLGIDIMEAGLD